jgi:Golgi apyrase
MPPPAEYDSWLHSRRFGIVIDAGSSGSRLQIYSWLQVQVHHGHGYEDYDPSIDRLPQVEKGTKNSDDWMAKIEPGGSSSLSHPKNVEKTDKPTGISSFAYNPSAVGAYLSPLITHALSEIPPSLRSETPIFLLATAGMRLLPKPAQTSLLTAACSYLRSNTPFRLDEPSSVGSCGSSIRIISGEEEGLFGWIAVNYLMDGFGNHNDSHRATFGFLDMGGASTQIAFEPSSKERDKMSKKGLASLVDVRLRLLSGEEITHKVFVTTFLGYGTNQARERYISSLLSSSSDAHSLLSDPCLPKSLTQTSSSPPPSKPHSVVGTGSFSQCLASLHPLLNKSLPCPDVSCLFAGVPAPSIDFSLSHFIGVSEYWYSSEHIFGLGGVYDFEQYERAANEYCAREWDDIWDEFERGSNKKWGKEVERSRLEMQCFKAAWITNVLHEGIGLPRSPSSHPDIDEKASEKHLRPTFQSVDTIGDTSISWTLGKMVLEASKEIPKWSASDKSPPIRDPLEPTQQPPSGIEGPSKRPSFIDFDGLEDSIAHHIPSILSRHSLGFSPILSAIYIIAFVLFFYILYRIRRKVRRSVRRVKRKEREDIETEGIHSHSLELSAGDSGYSTSSSSPTSRPSSPPRFPGSGWKLLSRLQRLTFPFRHVLSLPLSLSRRERPRYNPYDHEPYSYTTAGPTNINILNSSNGGQRVRVPSSQRLSPLQLPPSNTAATTATSSSAYLDPPTDMFDPTYRPNTPRFPSRNSSSLNLTTGTLTTRVVSMSRTGSTMGNASGHGSGVQTPVNGLLKLDDFGP